MNMPITLLSGVLNEYRILTRVAVDRDLAVMRDRVEHEGMSFLTITLPLLDDALLRGLALGRLTPSMFPGFKPWKRGGNLPALLAGFFRRVFDTDGLLLDQPCINSIDAIRQATRLYKKVELPCSEARVTAAFERFESNEQKCFSNSCRHLDSDHLWSAISGFLWSGLEQRASDLYCSPGVFGSGATSERYRLNRRYDIREWPRRGETQFPASYHTSHNEYEFFLTEEFKFLDSGSERPVRVVTVPKTLKTPRIIAVEPSYAMLRQQSIWRYLRDYLEGPSFPFSSIRFTDQTVNRKLACIGSSDGALSTIDLSDASDLVSNHLVARVFRSCPSFLRYIYGARTRKAKLPNGKILNLRKYASMGSALCFPIESMVFFTIALYAVCKESGKRPSRSVLRELSKSIAVYGDDIITPTLTAGAVMRELEACGLRVNADKSFDSGLFRESCGGDYYSGENVTPVYVRQPWNEHGTKLESRTVAAYISLSNQFYMKGLWNASQIIRDSLYERGIRIGRSVEGIGGLTYHSCVFTDAVKWCGERHQYLVRSRVPKAEFVDDTIDTIHGAMLYANRAKLDESGEYPLFDRGAGDRYEARLWCYSGGRIGCVLHKFMRDQQHAESIKPGAAHEHTPDRSFIEDDSPESRRPDDSRSSIYDPAAQAFLLRTYRRIEGKCYDGTSQRPYSLNLKNRLTPTRVGLVW